MNDTEKYQFDLNGYLLVRGILDPAHVHSCLAAANALRDHMAANIDSEPQYRCYFNLDYRFDEKYQCHSYKNQAGGMQYVIDDFLNASSAFDVLVNHEPTMRYVRELCPGPYRILSSELRCRYKSNTTPAHMGGPMDTRNKYEFAGRPLMDLEAQKPVHRDFNLNIVRVLYALHDVPVEQGPLCVVPGSHKANFYSPFDRMDPTAEPGMIPLPMAAGDAIFFTENTRHGGFPNLLDVPRTTLHLAIGPRWVASQSPLHWDDQIYVSSDAWSRYSEIQRAIMPRPPSEAERDANNLRHGVSTLKAENERLRAEIERLQQVEPIVAPQQANSGFLKGLRQVFGR